MATLEVIRWIRHIPIAWRIPLAVVLNVAVALGLGLVGWHGAASMSADIEELARVQSRGQALADLDAQASRLESLIRQYLHNPESELLREINRRSDDLFSALAAATLAGRSTGEAAAMAEVARMNEAARHFVAGFQRLKALNAHIGRVYQGDIIETADEISGLYAVLGATAQARPGSRLAPALIKSHGEFVQALLAINTFYFYGSSARAGQARDSLERMTAAVATLQPMADSDVQSNALTVIAQRVDTLREGVDTIAHAFDDRSTILAKEVDANQIIMAAAVDHLMSQGHAREEALHEQSRHTLRRAAAIGLSVGLTLLVVGSWASWNIGQSIRRPLLRLRQVMEAGAKGDWTQEVEDCHLNDELAAMARTVEVFKRNALEKVRLEGERAHAVVREGETKRRTLQDLLARIEAHEHSSALPVPSEETEAAEIAAAFNRVLVKFHAAFRDRDEAIAALTAAKEQAEAANHAKSAFLATMIQEFRAPTNAVLGGTDLLARTGLEATQLGIVETVHDAAAALLRILDDVLEYSVIDAGRLTLERVPLSLAAVLDEVAGTLAHAAAEKGVSLDVFVDPGIPGCLLGDPLRLRQIVFNLCENAVRFTERGRVRLCLYQLARGQGTVTVALRVADTGIGIPAAVLRRLFQPFIQAAPAAARHAGRTGLGLAITRGLVGAMAGDIRAEPCAGGGTTLHVTLTLGYDPSVPEPWAEVDLMGLRVLVVSPDAGERSLIARHLEASGAAVVRVPGPEGALAAAQRACKSLAPFDLALLSCGITPVDLAPLAPTPLLFLGADICGEDFALFERMPNTVGFLGRPITPQALAEAVSRSTRRSRADGPQGWTDTVPNL